MSTYTQILYQIVFGSKNCAPFLNSQNQTNLYNYIYGIVQNKNSVPYIVGGHSNHIHIITTLHPTVSLSESIRDIKKASHNWMTEKKDLYSTFYGWKVGYGAITYNYFSKKNLIHYVKNQNEHHKKNRFSKWINLNFKRTWHWIQFEIFVHMIMKCNPIRGWGIIRIQYPGWDRG